MNVTYVTELLFSIYVMFIIKTYIKSEVKSASRMFEQAVDLILVGLLRRERPEQGKHQPGRHRRAT